MGTNVDSSLMGKLLLLLTMGVTVVVDVAVDLDDNDGDSVLGNDTGLGFCSTTDVVAVDCGGAGGAVSSTTSSMTKRLSESVLSLLSSEKVSGFVVDRGVVGVTGWLVTGVRL